MTIYGNECGGSGLLLFRDGNTLIGEYSSPVDITETYLGEPYAVYVDMGTIGGRQGWQMQLRRGDGALVETWQARDIKLTLTLDSPVTEEGKWTLNWNSSRIWNGTAWVNSSASSQQNTIARYAYTITAV